MFLDIKKAHFWAPARRRILVELPDELGLSTDYVGLLRRSLYGTRDAPSNWAGTKSGSEICCALSTGDDFMIHGQYEHLVWLRDSLSREWTVEIRGVLARPDAKIQQLSVLSRLVSWTASGIMFEADPRHVDLVLKESGLCNGSAVTSPLVKAKPTDDWNRAEAARYRSLAMRIGHLSCDQQRATRELAKGLQNPTQHHWSLLKRIARSLKGHGTFFNQEHLCEVTTWSNTDHAGIYKRLSNHAGVQCDRDWMQGPSCHRAFQRRGRVLRTGECS